MTARRRRKSGSGPSATALIAWVGGAQTEFEAPTGTSVSMIHGESPGRVAGGRAVLVGRACGLAAGTLLACGSVLAGATHVGDGSLVGDSAPLLSHSPFASGSGSGTFSEAQGQVPAERTPAAPESVSAQAVVESSPGLHPRLGQVHRNTPVSVDPLAAPRRQSPTAPRPWSSPPPATGHAPTGPIAPVSPVLDPAAQGVGRVAPVGGVLTPTNPAPANPAPANPRDERTNPSPIVTVTPHLDKVIQPARAMLTSLLPAG
jgi:hypothetical protein